MMSWLPFLPMGTIMTVCMLLGLLFSVPFDPWRSIWRSWWKFGDTLAGLLRACVAIVVLLAGCWNLFWYGLRNVPDFWGAAAAVSGVLMLLTGLFILKPLMVSPRLAMLKPFVWLGLLACFLTYAITILTL